MENNKIAKVILWIGIVEIVISIIIGVTSGSWKSAIIWCGGGFISGMIFIAFAEVINILHETRHFTYQNYKLQGGKEIASPPSQFESFRPNF